jgi:hypothetical protein
MAVLATSRRVDAQSLAATITSPANGAVSADLSHPIQWTAVINAEAYYLYVGSTPGATDLVNTGEIQQTSYLAAALPVGPTIYARLWTRIAGTWHFTDSTFTVGAPPAVSVATITYPPNAAAHADLSQPIQWTTIAGAQAYYLYVGTTQGARDIVNSGEMSQTSYVLRTFPANQLLYARIYTKLGGAWRFTDSTFSGDVLTAQITSPLDATTTADWAQPIQWTTVSTAQAYYLYVGTSQGANNLINSGELHQTSYSASSLPANQTVYARLYTEVGGVWRYIDSSFRGDILTTRIISPVNGATTADWMQPIQWTIVPNAQAYYLYVGSSLGAHDLINTGEMHQTSYVATNLPASRVVYARMFAEVGGVWRYTDSSFSGDILTARITSPANDPTANASANLAQPIQWTTVPSADAYYLYVGSSFGANNLINTGEIHQTSYPIDTLPPNLRIYARIYAKVGGVWRFTDSSFIGATLTATITSPSNGATNANPLSAIQWTTVPNVQAYYLYVGTTIGGKNLVDTGELQQTSVLPAALPAGQPLYARLWTKVAGVWRYVDSTFSMAFSTTSTITYPPDGALYADSLQPIQWTSIANAQSYKLYVGTAVGAKDLIDTGPLQVTSFAATGLPAGQTLYARLWTQFGGVWRYVDSAFTMAVSVATLTYPANGSTTADLSLPIQWNNNVFRAQGYELYLGTAIGASDLADSGVTLSTYYKVSAVPTGPPLYARLWTKVNGVWQYSDSSFIAAARIPQDVMIAFDSFAGGSPLTTYAESGFTVTATEGNWTSGPAITFNAPSTAALVGQVQVAESAGAPFHFKSVDLYSSVTPIPYTITGLRNLTPVFTMTGTVPNTFGNFKTVVNPQATELIDTLVIRLTNIALVNPMGLDNISLSR